MKSRLTSEKVDADEELKEELKGNLLLFQRKFVRYMLEQKFSHAAARLGLRILPDELQGEVGEALVVVRERTGNLLEKAL